MYGDSTGLVRDCPVSSAGSRAGHAVGTVLPLLGQVERGAAGALTQGSRFGRDR